MESLKMEHTPGAASISLKLKDIERQQEKLLNKKDKYQSKFESRENKVKIYTNERDKIADKFIGRYDEKLKPMEEKLERLQTCKNEMDAAIAGTKAKHNRLGEHLATLEEKKRKLEEAYRKAGMSERKIKKDEAVKTFEEIIAGGRDGMRKEMEALEWQKTKINEKIAKGDRKANPYRDKREKFVRVKEGRPIEMGVETRTRGETFKGEEEMKTHTRRERPESQTEESEEAGNETEQAKEGEETFEAKYLLDEWNAYLTPKAVGYIKDVKDFMQTTRLYIFSEVKSAEFKNILEKYYKARKVLMNKYALEANVDAFFKKIKNKK